MKANLSERLLNPGPHRERERRPAAVRKAMAGHGVAAQSNNHWLGGHARWLTGHPATSGYPKTVVFQAGDVMTGGGIRTLGGNDAVHEAGIAPAVCELPDLLLQPRQGSATVETRTAIGAPMIANLSVHFAGQKLPAPVTSR